VNLLCKIVGMTRQNYYKAQKSQQKKEVYAGAICEAVLELRQKHPRMGTRKLLINLKKRGVDIGRDRLFFILKEFGLLVPPVKRKAKTTNSRHSLPVFRNLIKDLNVTHRNQVWVSDLTYLRIAGGFVYLSLVMDLYSRKIVGWHCGDTLEAIGCMNALRMAFGNLAKGEQPIHHSDRGCQYCCHAYVEMLNSKKCGISMTEENHCYENANAERLNGILKQEYCLDSLFKNLAQARKATAQAINLYNNERLHEALAYAIPAEFYRKNAV
jgi:putative transposase